MTTTSPAAANGTGLDLAAAETHPPPPGLRSLSFLGLLIVQFCTALNDNTFRWLVVPIAKPLVGEATALAVGLAGFTLPFLVCAAPAGYLADRFSKARVITAFRLIEAIVLGIGLLTVATQNAYLLFGVVILTGALTALFAPAKLGSLPEVVAPSELSTANGWMGVMVVMPAALGFLLGNVLSAYVLPAGSKTIQTGGLVVAAAVIMTVALTGWLASLLIRRAPPADPARKWSWNLIGDAVVDLKRLKDQPVLWQTALGIAYFWSIAALAQVCLDSFAINDLGLEQTHVGLLGMVLVLGVGGGNVLAGVLSAGRIELGLVPLGAAGIVLCSILLFATGQLHASLPSLAFYGSCLALLGLGICSGLFDVPLEAYLQHRSPPSQLGSVIAAMNFLAFTGILGVSGLFYLLQGRLGFSSSTIFLLTGLATIPVGVQIARKLPATMLRMLAWVLSHSAYHLRVVGREHVPREGGVLLMPNHVTWVDGILLLVTVPRPVRFIVYADYVEHPRLAWLARIFEIIPIRSNSGPKALMQSIKVAREALANGECVCIFAEGTLTRTGQMQPFQPGFLKILQGTDCPIVPVCLHGLWGSIFSYWDKKFFWKWPRAWRYPVTVVFGEPMPKPETAMIVSERVRELGMTVVEQQRNQELTPARKTIRSCRRGLRQIKVADSSGLELTGGKFLAGALAFGQVLRRNVLKARDTHVGILLPPTVACALANVALTLSRRVTVNLNYTMSEADLKFCVQEAGLRYVITSRKMLEKKPVDLGVEWIFLEDLKTQVTGFDKFRAGLGAFVLPAFWTERQLGLTKVKADDPITVIFTSGSTGEPKGVMISQHNISATVAAAESLFQIHPTDTVLGIVPIFHSLGYLGTLWLPLCVDPKVVYHTNPLDARQIGELAEKYSATILFATPTFLRTYLKRCTKEQFGKLDLVVVGAEKLPVDLAHQFQEKFGVQPTEGYGATETTGPAAVNVPDHRCEMVEQRGTKLGTVGRPLPDLLIRAVDPDSRTPLAANTEGLIEIKGYNVMLGYLNRPEKTAAVLRDGWYNTGDMGFVDDEGFVHITGRLSRFSKIGGEMVPHIKIEECLLRIVETPEDDGKGPLLAVTAVPDAKKGERIVVLHRALGKDVPAVLKELGACNLPNLWLPDADSFLEVDVIPMLGTGKADLKAIRKLAEERFAPAVASV